MDTDIIIIGGGICGLSIAKELIKADKKVLLLEARMRMGGRIHTIKDKFSWPVDAGAEFIHGNLPLTKALMREAGIAPYHREGKTYKSKGKTIYASTDFIENMDLVLAQLDQLEKDLPLAEFLEASKIDDETKTAIINFAEGFDVAAIEKVSSFSLRDEWKKQNEEITLQIKEGHSRIINYLSEYCLRHGCNILLNAEVNRIQWEKEHVKVNSINHDVFEASKVIITVPMGVLLTEKADKGHIEFSPAIPRKMEAMKKIGFGSVVKVILEFKTAFWLHKAFESQVAQLPELDFLIGESFFSVWWTHPIPDAPILIGWLGGPKAKALKDTSQEEILAKALVSLAAVLLTTTGFIDEQLTKWEVVNWGADPYTRGAYSFNMLSSKEAKKILAEPIEQTVYFAGEAISDSESIGTVESAIASGKQTAKRILQVNQAIS